MTKKLFLFVGLNLAAAQTLACGDTASYEAMEIASLAVLGLFTLSALLLPTSSILVNQRTTTRTITVLAGIVSAGLLGAGALFIIDTQVYMRPLAVVMIAVSFFVPILYGFVQSVTVFKQRNPAE